MTNEIGERSSYLKGKALKASAGLPVQRDGAWDRTRVEAKGLLSEILADLKT